MWGSAEETPERAAERARTPQKRTSAPGSRTHEALLLTQGKGQETTRRMVEAYGDWAGDSGTVEARRMLLDALFKDTSVPSKLSGALGAIASDNTPPEEDPLWKHAVESLANVWQGEMINPGLDLMVAETRPRARAAIVASFMQIVNSERASELTSTQTQTLTNYMIDLFKDLPDSQKPEVAETLRKVAGNDVADIMLGKGLNSDDELEGARAYKEALKSAAEAAARAPQAVAQAPAAAPAAAPAVVEDEYEDEASAEATE
jgi:hypothetical protein